MLYRNNLDYQTRGPVPYPLANVVPGATASRNARGLARIARALAQQARANYPCHSESGEEFRLRKQILRFAQNDGSLRRVTVCTASVLAVNNGGW